MNYHEARAYLNQISKTGSILGLQSITSLMNELGNPQDDMKFIHLAGTNGKGSILAYTANILKAAGYTVGAYISPSVMGYQEKYQIDCQWMPEDDLPPLVERVKAAAESMEATGMNPPTVFEMETAIAFLYFKEHNCDYVVLETGLGGDMDSTNVVTTTQVCAFASISLDHTQILGDTLAEIAGKKSGIIKTGAAVVAGWQQAEAYEVISAKAKSLGCEIISMNRESLHRFPSENLVQQFEYKEYTNLRIRLLGQHQLENAAVAIEITDSLKSRGAEISEDALREGLYNAEWPGRFEIIPGSNDSPVIVMDGAHNPDAAGRLAAGLEEYFAGKKITAVMGMFRDKDCDAVADILAPYIAEAFTVSLPDENRTLAGERLAELMDDRGVRAKSCDSIENAISHAIEAAGKYGIVLITGSLSYLEEAGRYIADRLGR